MASTVDSAPRDFKLSARRRAGSNFVIPAWVFICLAALLLAFLLALGLLGIVSVTYVNTAVSRDRLLDRGWALHSLLSLAWAVANLYWARKAARLLKLEAIYGHLALAIGCGLIALATHAILLARALGSQPIVLDYAHADSSSSSRPGATVAAPAQGDAEEGRKIFSTTCITCHGPTGDGLPNLAPSLRGSAFIAAADDTAIANTIRLGRPVGDPSNKSGKVMPARGGNPFLGDDKVVHLVAYVRAIQFEGAGPTASADPNAPPAVQLARWVLPAGPSPPPGMVRLDARQDIGDALSIAARRDQRRQRLTKTFTLALAAIHGLFLMGVMIASSNLLLHRLANISSKSDKLWSELSSLGWLVAVVSWGIVFLFGFVWLA